MNGWILAAIGLWILSRRPASASMAFVGPTHARDPVRPPTGSPGNIFDSLLGLFKSGPSGSSTAIPDRGGTGATTGITSGAGQPTPGRTYTPAVQDNRSWQDGEFVGPSTITNEWWDPKISDLPVDEQIGRSADQWDPFDEPVLENSTQGADEVDEASTWE